MFRGYVSSDSDLDDLDELYCEPPVKIKNESRSLLEMQNERFSENLNSAMRDSNQLDLFLNAAHEGDFNTLEELILLGVSVDCSKDEEWTPLLKACQAGNFEVVKFLLEHGSDPNLHKDLITPLLVCCHSSGAPERSKLNCVKYLLQYGAGVNKYDKYSTTALMYASESGYEDIVTELLAVPDINVNLQDKEGFSALFYAVLSKNENIAKKLKLAGIDLTLKDKFNRTAMDLALENGLQIIAELLGYVEEKNTDFQEKEIEANYRFLQQLPDSFGKGGFELDVKHVMDSLNLKNIKDISFPEFLNITNEGLINIGVTLKSKRQKILTLIHLFHLHPWASTSIHEIESADPLHTEDAVAVTGDIAKHLTLANASLQYISTRLTSNSGENCDNKAIENLLITLTDIHQTVEKLNIYLPKILNHINQMKPEVMDDYIYPYKENKTNKYLKYLFYGSGVTAVGYLLRTFCWNTKH